MSEPIAKHELFEYKENEPFLILKLSADIASKMAEVNGYSIIANHWHEELELAYIVGGKSYHYIDGECVEGIPGRLVVTNSESAHNIIQDATVTTEEEILAIIILIHAQFLNEVFPQYKSIYFTNEKEKARQEIVDIIQKLSVYADREDKKQHDMLYAKGLILQLLYYMCEEGMMNRDEIDVNTEKNIERLKGVLTYIENHYMEDISQAKVAKKFYFNKEYFSRYFKSYMGITYTEYVMYYRAQKAEKAILQTDKRMIDIALENGFSDERRLINTFKKFYGITPFQYRKKVKEGEQVNKR